MVEIGDILVLVCASGRAVRLSGPILKSLAQILVMPSQNQNSKRHPRFHNADSRPKKSHIRRT